MMLRQARSSRQVTGRRALFHSPWPTNWQLVMNRKPGDYVESLHTQPTAYVKIKGWIFRNLGP